MRKKLPTALVSLVLGYTTVTGTNVYAKPQTISSQNDEAESSHVTREADKDDDAQKATHRDKGSSRAQSINMANVPSIETLELQINKISGELELLKSSYLSAAALQGHYKAELQYNDAKVAYFAGDYERAALLLADVVSTPSFQAFPTYWDALFVLADSLIKTGDIKLAHNYLSILIKSGPEKYKNDAAKLFLRTAIEAGSYEQLINVAHLLMQNSTLDSNLTYMLGQAYFNRKKYDEAIEVFKKLSQDQSFRGLSNYYMGASYVGKKDLRLAKSFFEKNIQTTLNEKNVASQEMIDLSRMALGRIAYEEGTYNEAINHYAEIGHTSPYFLRGLWELSWVYLALDNYVAASRNLEILLLGNPEPDLEADARMLQADILLKLQQYDRSDLEYKKLVERFGPAIKEMNHFIARHDDVEAYFYRLSKEGERKFAITRLDQVVDRFIDYSEATGYIRQLMSQMKRLEDDIKKTETWLKEIQSSLKTRKNIAYTTSHGHGSGNVIKLEYEIISILRGLLDNEKALVIPKLSHHERNQWQSHERFLEQLGRVLVKSSGAPGAQIGVKESVYFQYVAMERELASIKDDIHFIERELNASNRYVLEHLSSDVSGEKRKKIQELQQKLTHELENLKAKKLSLSQEIVHAKELTGAQEKIEISEKELRKRYRERLVQAFEWLKERRKGGDFSEIDQLYSIAASYEKILGEYLLSEEDMLLHGASKLQRELAEEQKYVEMNQKILQDVLVELSQKAGVLALVNFLKVRDKFEVIVMRGEVGQTDVAWQRKDDLSKKISEHYMERTRQLKDLQKTFREVR